MFSKVNMFLRIFLLAILLLSCNSEGNKIYQYSTIDLLMQGNYEGEVSIQTIRKHGDFGIGTFNALDGEMIVLNGKVFQARKDGVVAIASDDMKSPFVSVCFFKPTLFPEITKVADLKTLETLLQQNVDDQNVVYAVKIEGVFDSISLRSVVPQTKPYKPLVEVVKQQSVFQRVNSNGTLVGFLCPASLGKVAVGGLHLHYISADYTTAGHVLNVSFDSSVSFSLSKITAFDLHLMTTTNQNKIIGVSEKDIQKVEQ